MEKEEGNEILQLKLVIKSKKMSVVGVSEENEMTCCKIS